VEAALAELQQLCSNLEGRREWSELQPLADFNSHLAKLVTAVEGLQEALEALAERSTGLGNCHQRGAQIVAGLQKFSTEDVDNNQVRWIERRGHGFSLNLTPVDVAGRFRDCMREAHCGWIFLSATLSINGSFEHFRGRLGLEEAEELLFGSPFDYQHHALLYVPGTLPEVNRPEYTAAVVRAAEPVILASGGARVFCCSPAIAHCARPRRWCASAGPIRCWCRATPRAGVYWSVSASSAMPCCWAPRVSGRVWM